MLGIARGAGAAVMPVYRAYQRHSVCSPLIAHKADATPLTSADLLAHDWIVEGLARLSPGIPVVSEEDAASLAALSACGDFWLIDPLDGTKEFLARSDEFTVNIALVRDGVAVLGVVSAPALRLDFWGGRGMGAYRETNGHRSAIAVAASGAANRPLRVVASKSHMNTMTASFIDRLGEVELLQAGSSLKFCRVAEGAADVYPRLGPTCQWDTAAAQAVLEGAGGQVCTPAGAPLMYGAAQPLNPHFIAAPAWWRQRSPVNLQP